MKDSRVCYNERMLQRTFSSIKSGCYNERGGILVFMETPLIVFSKERLFMLFIGVSLFIVFTTESFFMPVPVAARSKA